MAWVFSAVFAALFLLMAVHSWLQLFRYGLKKNHGVGIAGGCVGGFSGALALLFAPMPGLAKWCWVPLVLDLSCLPALAYTVYYWAFVARQNPLEINPKGALACPQCSVLSSKWASFCATCGHSLADATLLPKVRPERIGSKSKGADKLACQHCHLVSSLDCQFCSGCGMALDNARRLGSAKRK